LIDAQVHQSVDYPIIRQDDWSHACGKLRVIQRLFRSEHQSSMRVGRPHHCCKLTVKLRDSRGTPISPGVGMRTGQLRMPHCKSVSAVRVDDPAGLALKACYGGIIHSPVERRQLSIPVARKLHGESRNSRMLPITLCQFTDSSSHRPLNAWLEQIVVGGLSLRRTVCLQPGAPVRSDPLQARRLRIAAAAQLL
jgi:hypothetical protein